MSSHLCGSFLLRFFRGSSFGNLQSRHGFPAQTTQPSLAGHRPNLLRGGSFLLRLFCGGSFSSLQSNASRLLRATTQPSLAGQQPHLFLRSSSFLLRFFCGGNLLTHVTQQQQACMHSAAYLGRGQRFKRCTGVFLPSCERGFEQ